MSDWWQSTWDPYQLLIDHGKALAKIDHQQRELAQIQNQLAATMRDLVIQHNELVSVIRTHKQAIEQLNKDK